MAEVKWIKLTTDMFDNRKIKHLRRLPDGNSIVLIWVMLLTMAGRCNASGMIFLTENIPYTPKMLADELDFEENTVVLALRALEDLNMVVTNKGYFAIAGWEEYQNIEGMDKIRESKRLAQARWRAKQKELPNLSTVDSTVDSTRCLVDDAEEDKEEELEKDKEDICPFDEFWTAYPKKKAKEAARKAWSKLKPNETLGKEIIQAVMESAKTKDWLKENGKYIPYPATYLNGKRWEDERNNANGQDTGNTRKVQYGTVL